jgi:hypothetical protein
MNTDKMLDRLEVLAKRRIALEAEIDGLVGMLRAEEFAYDAESRRWVADCTWSEIGDALGISRQAAHQLYRRRWATIVDNSQRSGEASGG